MGEILVGTASWTDPTLIASGRFYPPQAKTAQARLQYYASQFPLVEIDSTYYALPHRRTAELWAERTPADFVFDAKAFRLFTGHPAQVSALPVDLRGALAPTGKSNLYLRDLPEEVRAELWQRFRLGLEPLRQSGKLGVVLLQFAPWFVFGRESFAHIAHCAQMLDGFRLAVEFRNESWFVENTREQTLAFERDHGLVHVVVDEPQGFASSIPQVWEVTCPDLAILRFKTDQLGRGMDFRGLHHFGILVDDIEQASKAVTASGGRHYMDQAEPERIGGFEVKMYGPEGILFDIAEHPWTGTEALPVLTQQAAE